MGLLRRPTTSEIVEDGRISRPYGLGAHSCAFKKTSLRLRRHSYSSATGRSLTCPSHRSRVRDEEPEVESGPPSGEGGQLRSQRGGSRSGAALSGEGRRC